MQEEHLKLRNKTTNHPHKQEISSLKTRLKWFLRTQWRSLTSLPIRETCFQYEVDHVQNQDTRGGDAALPPRQALGKAGQHPGTTSLQVDGERRYRFC